MSRTLALGPRVVVAAATDPGCDPTKQVNEDAWADVDTPRGRVLVVCDGMGGRARGAEASRAAARAVVDGVARSSAALAPGAALARAIADAGRAVWALAGAEPDRPGSTCVAALLHAGGAEIAHVGDSRAHLVRGGRVFTLTRDHSVVQALVDAGRLAPDDARAHPEAGKITRALGLAPDVEVDVRPAPLALAADDRLLLASDGLTDLVSDEELAREAAAPDPEVAVGRLVALARARGAPDNVTVLLARVVDPGAAAATAEALARATLVAPAHPTRAMALADAPPPTLRHEAPTRVDPPAAPRASTAPEPEAALAERRLRAIIGATTALVLLVVLAAIAWAVTHERPRRGGAREPGAATDAGTRHGRP